MSNVSSISFQGTAQTAVISADVKTLVKYVSGESLKNIPDTFSSTTKNGVEGAGFFSVFPFLRFLKNKKITGEATKQLNEKLVAGDKAMLESFKKIFKKDGVKISQKIADYSNLVDANASVYSDIKSTTSTISKLTKATAKKAKITERLAKSHNKLIQEILNKKLAKAEKVISKSQSKLEELAIKETGKHSFFKKIGDAFKNLLGKHFKPNTVAKFGKVGKFMKSTGAGFMLVFSGISEAFQEVVPTFKELGKEKGMKQIGKSTVKVVGDAAGYVAGAAIGKMAGAALGAKIGAVAGSIVPGIGNVIGAGVGLVCGLLGSFIAGKITKKITGPTERELAKQQQQQETTQQIINDKDSLEALKEAAAVKILEEAEANGGDLSEDSQIALQTLQKMEESPEENIFAA